MIDFLLGLACVAMIVSPAFVATCLRHMANMDLRLVPMNDEVPRELARRRGL